MMAGIAWDKHWRNRYLVWQLTKREIAGRYRGSTLGLTWSIVNPLLMLVVYTFVFSVVFKARWDVGTEDSKSGFAIILFAGLILNNFFAECVNRAPTLIVANVNFVKKIVFPVELLPVVSTLSALFHLLISIIILLLAEIVLTGSLPWTALGLPLLIVPFFIACVGIGWLLASVGVYIRDIAYITGLLTTIALFVSPVFYPISAVPPSFRLWIELNPLTFVFETGRGMLVQGLLPGVIPLLVFWLGCTMVGLFGFYWFERTKRGFADVL
ncbi:ABC transporter permease [Rhizobium ruizarguesonis]|nr:ABC transporter permease [Rhizobium ruizarguesonis]